MPVDIRMISALAGFLIAVSGSAFANQCDNSSLSGVLPVHRQRLHGRKYTNSSGTLHYLSPPQPLSSVGQFHTFDGQGSFTRVDFNVGNGVPVFNGPTTPVNEAGFRTGLDRHL